MDGLAAVGTLNCVYFILFAVGVGYAIIASALGHLSHIDLPGVDIDIPGIDLHPGDADIHLELPFAHDVSYDVDHPEVGLSPLSPITIATFITTFGGVGLIVNNLTVLSSLWGLIIATVSGLALAGAMFLFYARVLVPMQGSSEVHSGDLLGKVGEVIAPIPGDNVGEVAFVARGSRVTATARAADGQEIKRGVLVEITGVVGGVVTVRPQGDSADAPN